MSDIYPDAYGVYAYLAGSWVDISADVVSDISAIWGLPGNGPVDLMADVGHMEFVLGNSAGKYVPGLTGALAGWDKGTPVALVITYKSSTKRWRGRVDVLDPQPGLTVEKARVAVTVLDWLDLAVKHPLVSPGIYADKTADEALGILIPTMPIQPQATDYDAGVNVFPALFDDTTTQTKAYSELSKLAFSEVGYIYLRPDAVNGETLVFEGAHSRHGLRQLTEFADTSALTYLLKSDGGHVLKSDGGRLILNAYGGAVIDNTMKDLGVSYGRGMVNRMTVRAYPKRIDTSVQVLYKLESPMQIGSGETVTFRGGYTDPTGGATVNADPTTMVPPAATTDYTMNTERDGSGTNITANAVVVAVYGTEAVNYSVTNNSAYTGYFSVQARGYGIYQYNPIEGTEESAVSWNEYGYQNEALEQRYQRDLAAGMQAARKIVELEKKPRLKLNKISMNANTSHELMMAFMNLDVGGLVEIVNDQVEVDGWYWIQRVELVIKNGGMGFINFDWTVRQHNSLFSGLALVDCQCTAASTDGLKFGYLPQVSNLRKKSLSIWINSATLSSWIAHNLIKTYADIAGANAGWALRFVNGIALLNYVEGGDSAAHQGMWYVTTGLGPVIENCGWVLITLTRDSTNIWTPPKIYVNGVEQAITIVAPPTGRSNEDGLILTVGESFNGRVTDARVYDRILTHDEIEAMYEAGPGDMSLTNGLVFQAPCVRSEELEDYDGLELVEETKVLDNIQGVIGTATGAPITNRISLSSAESISSKSGIGVTILSWRHTVGKRANRLLTVVVCMRNFQSVLEVNVTYDADPGGDAFGFTKVGNTVWLGGDRPRAEIWTITAPMSGGCTIEVRLTGLDDFAAAMAIDFYNAHQTTPMGTFCTASGTSNAPSVTTDSTENDLVLDVLTVHVNGTATKGAEQTLLWVNGAPINASWRGRSSLGSVKRANKVMSWTLGTSVQWALAAISIKPAWRY